LWDPKVTDQTTLGNSGSRTDVWRGSKEKLKSDNEPALKDVEKCGKWARKMGRQRNGDLGPMGEKKRTAGWKKRRESGRTSGQESGQSTRGTVRDRRTISKTTTALVTSTP